MSHADEQRFWELKRARHSSVPDGSHVHRPRRAPDQGTVDPTLHLKQLEAGEVLTRAFLTDPVGAGLRSQLEGDKSLNASLELGIELADDALAPLPWETLLLPGGDGLHAPLALHERVNLFRTETSLGTIPAIRIAPPLRILVVIGSPEAQNARGELLDMERELSSILDAVEGARHAGAVVRIVEFGNLPAIRQQLMEERFHVLHVSCHAGPGVLILENPDGSEHEVTAAELCEQLLPPDRGVPLVVLAGCATGLAPRGEETEEALPSVARALLAHGVPSVLAMQAPVGDRYATELAGEFYRVLAMDDARSPLVALGEARRAVEQRRRAEKDDQRATQLAEWATPALYVRGESLRLVDPESEAEDVAAAPTPTFAPEVAVRRVGEFVGRRSERRRAARLLDDEQRSGALIHGLGGVGKSTLASRVLTDAAERGALLATVVGETTPDQILAEIGNRLFAQAIQQGVDERHSVRQCAAVLGRADIDWEQRLGVLSQVVLGELPIVLLVDNFEDNLVDEGPALRSEDLGNFLATWLRAPGKSRVVFTCRYPFELPHGAEGRLERLHLGPLTFAETRKLVWRLGGLDALGPDALRRAWERVGGHPRSLEYLDALLCGGKARYPDVQEKLDAALAAKGIEKPAEWCADAASNLDRALAETVSLAADDVLLERLLTYLENEPLARRLLIGASVYRYPVPIDALAWQVGEEREEDQEAVRRWDELQERLAKLQVEGADLADLAAHGLDPAEVQATFAALQTAPVQRPEGLREAIEQLSGLGLLAPHESGASEPFYFVHRWTAARLESLGVAETHRHAARFWSWRVRRMPHAREEQLELLVETRHHLREAGDTDEAIEATKTICTRLHTVGAWRREEQLCREVLVWVSGQPAAEAPWLHQLGVVSQARGDYDDALAWYRRSLQIEEELGNRAGMASTYHQLGIVSQARGDYDDALAWYRRSLQIEEELGNRAGMAISYHQLGIVSELRGDNDDALAWYRRSLQIEEELGNRAGMAISYHQLGMVSELRGDYDDALAWYRRSLQIKEELGDRAGVASTYHQLGTVSQARGDYDDALAWYRRSLQIAEELGDRAGMAITYHQLGMVSQARGDYDDALAWYRRSLQIAEELGDRAGMAITYHQLGLLSAARSTPGEAVAWQLRSLSIHAQLGAPQASLNLSSLGDLREELGADRFAEELAKHVDPESAANVLRMLDQASS